MAHAHPDQILSLPSESFADALRRLDPASRALLDLSLRRGMRPEEIAEVLGVDSGSVVVQRDEALKQVATDLGKTPDDPLDDVRARLAELPGDVWTGGPAPANGSAPQAAAAAEPEHERPPEARTGGERRSMRPLAILLGALVAAGAVVAIVLAASGGSSSPAEKRAPAAARSGRVPRVSRAPRKAVPGGAFAPVATNGAGARGSASIAGGHLRADITGLPAPHGATYEVWLYNSVIDARPLGSSGAAHVVVDAKLPRNAKRYRWVDVSLEPADGNPAHSGDSIVRVPLSRLERR